MQEKDNRPKPPTPIKGVKYEWLATDKLCSQCGRLVLKNQLVVVRTAIGASFKNILPAKNGICLSCGANGLSELSIKEYEKILNQITQYETMKDKKEVTKTEEKHIKLLGRGIENLQDFVNELSSFVKYSEDSGVAYYDDQIEESIDG